MGAPLRGEGGRIVGAPIYTVYAAYGSVKRTSI